MNATKMIFAAPLDERNAAMLARLAERHGCSIAGGGCEFALSADSDMAYLSRVRELIGARWVVEFAEYTAEELAQ